MRTLILHTGLPKCGSSSIQRSLFPARRELARRGIVYWGIGPNHSGPLKGLSRSFFERRMTPALRALYGSDDALEAQLRKVLGRRSAFTILSAEGMSKLNGPGNADAPEPSDARGRLRRAVLDSGFDRIRVVTYVRPPVQWWESLVQQRSKAEPIDDALGKTTSYRAMIEPMDTLLPEADHVLRMFEPATFRDGSLLADFFDTAGIPDDLVVGIKEVRANESLSAEATAFLDRLQRRAGTKDSIRTWFIEHYLRPNLSGGGRFHLPREVLANLIEQNRDDLAWISARLGRDMTPVLPPAGGDSAGAPPPDDRIASLVLALMEALGESLSREALDAARRTLAAGKPDKARREVIRALSVWPKNRAAEQFLANLEKRG